MRLTLKVMILHVGKSGAEYRDYSFGLSVVRSALLGSGERCIRWDRKLREKDGELKVAAHGLASDFFWPATPVQPPRPLPAEFQPNPCDCSFLVVVRLAY